MAQARLIGRPRHALTDPHRPRRAEGPTPPTRRRDDPAAEQELMRAMDAYKLGSGRMFPTWSEVLEVIQGLGYEKTPGA